MAHAPAELRDPTTSPGKPPPGRADDLLSQLAGKEIDRLLADADLDGEAGFGATRPANDRWGGRTPAPAGRDGSGEAGPAPTKTGTTGDHAGEAAEGVDAAEDDQPPPAPEVDDALAGAQDTLSKELDQVFDRQLDDATGGTGGEREATRADTGAKAAVAAESRTPAESQPEDTAGAVETPTRSGWAVAAAPAADASGDEEHVSLDAAAAAGGTGDPQEAAAATPASAADGVGDLLSRLSAGERPPPPEEGSIVAADPNLTADPGAATSPGFHPSAEASVTPAAAGPEQPERATDREHAAHDATTTTAVAHAEHPPRAEALHAGGDGQAAAALHAAAPHAGRAPAATPAGGGAAQAEVVHLPAAEPGPSWADKVLAVVAVPLDPFPDEVRDAVGKVAIITAVNGVAVLVYVMFFRG